MAENPPYNTRVYKTLQHVLKDSFTTPEDEFYNKLTSDPEYANKVHKTLTRYLGDSYKKDEKEFLSAVGFKKKDQSSPSGVGRSSTSVVDEMVQKVEEAGGKPSLEEIQSKPQEEYTTPQTAASSTRVDESYAVRLKPTEIDPVDVMAQIKIQKKKLNNRIDNLSKTLEHAQSKPAFGQAGTDVKGYELADEMSAQYRAAPEVVQRDTRKLREYSQMKDMLDHAEKLSKKYDSNSWESLKGGLSSQRMQNYLTLGLTEIMENTNVAQARSKDPEQRTPEEQAYIDTYDILSMAKATDQPLTYEVGRGIIESIPFMVQFALSGGSASTVQKGVQSLFKKQLKTQTQKKAAQGLAYMSGKAVQTAIVPATYQNISQRAASGESLPASIVAGYASTLAEFSSEGIFGAPVSKQASTMVQSGGLRGLLNNARKATAISTGGREFVEEEISATAQAVIDNDYESLDEFKTHATMYITSQAISSGFSALQGTASAYDRFESKRKEKALEGAEKDLKEIDNKISNIKEGLDEVSNLPYDQQAEAVTKIIDNYDLEKEDEVVILEYLAGKNRKVVADAVKENNDRQEKLMSDESAVIEKEEIDNHDVAVLDNVDQELEKTDHELNKKIDAIDPEINNRIKQLKEEKVSLQERQNRVDTKEEVEQAKAKEKQVGDELLSELKKRQKIRNDVRDKSLNEVLDEPLSKIKEQESVREEQKQEVSEQDTSEGVELQTEEIKDEKQETMQEEVKEDKPQQKEKVKPEDLSLGETKPATKAMRRILNTSDEAVTLPLEEGGNKVGEITRDGWQIKKVNVESEQQRRGIATEAYRKLNQQANQEGEVLRSDKQGKVDYESRRIWESLVKSGEAEQLEDGTYKFKENVQEQKQKTAQQQESVQAEAKEQKAIAFNFTGERRFGAIKEETPDAWKVVDSDGINHTIPKTKQSSVYSNINTETAANEMEDSDNTDTYKEKFRQKLIQRKIDEGPTSSGVKVNFRNAFKKGGEIFDVYQGIPKEFYKANMRVTGKVNRTLDELQTFIRDFDKKAKKAYGKYGDTQKETIQSALENMGTDPEGQIAAMEEAGIPESLHGDIIRMRNDIDQLSSAIMEAGMLSDELEVKFSNNRGMYLTRTYRRGKDKDWNWETIPDNVKVEAAAVLHEYYPNKSDSWIEGTLKSMLTDTEISSLIGTSLGKVKKDILQRRSDFLTDHSAIRDFLGEYRDPAYNYAVSISKMTEMIERQKMLDTMKNMGLENGWLQEEKSDTHYVKIGTTGATSIFYSERQTEEGETEKRVRTKSPSASKGYKPIGEYYTTPEIKEAFDSFNEFSRAGAGMMGSNIYERFVTAAKLSKTAFSIKSNIRNFLSNPINALANGNWNFKEIIEEYKRYSDGDGIGKFFSNAKGHELRLKMIELGIVGDNVVVGQIKDNMRKLRGWNHQLERGTLSVRDFFLKTYSLGDDFWKVTRFLSESGKYRKAYMKQGMSESQAQEAATEKAIDILHRTAAFYSMQPKMLQFMRKFPVTGTFVSFPYLTMQNFYNTNVIALEEIRSPGTTAIGIQRMLGAWTAFSAVATAGLLANRYADFDEEDVEDLRKFLAPFWKNDVVSFKRNDDGSFQYRNWSYLDYYTSVTQPTIMLGRQAYINGEITTEDITNSVKQFFEPYLSTDIVFGKVAGIVTGTDPQTGRKVYSENNKFADIFWYMADAINPATFTDLERYFEAKRKGEDADNILKGMLTGNQVRNLNIVETLDKYMLPDIEDKINNARFKEFKKLEYEARSQQRIEEGRQKAEQLINGHVSHLRDLYMAALRQGQKERELKKTFKDNLDNDIANAVFRGSTVRLTKDGDIE